jgi:hypothetical protein
VVGVTDPYGRILGFLDRNHVTITITIPDIGNWIYSTLEARNYM